jgi:hypothetical protein
MERGRRRTVFAVSCWRMALAFGIELDEQADIE